VIVVIKYETTEYKGKGCTVRVHRPILTKEERNKREEAIKKALCQFEIERRSRPDWGGLL
jgi:hypothetical protein